ncbi:MBL fold metallo-hydrolase [Alteribacillus sp. JSM 102045]|uniref:MBL fold metallo-hydrolase n=1 Tax=Alteribacillus sp. JSM 102045 TaxID=1562101 RepID=UPI0035C1D348
MNLTKIEGGGYRIGIPVPFPMKYVYCHLIPRGKEYVLIDVGLNYREARETWEKVFLSLNISPSSICEIYLTHFHPDHSGLAGWMQEKTGANVYIHDLDRRMMHQVWGEDSDQSIRVKTMMKDYGVPVSLSEKIADHMDKLVRKVTPLPTMHTLPNVVEFDGRSWQVIHAPGHSDGLVCLYDPKKQVLFSADLILDPITPNISVWPGARQNPLHDYLHSLRYIQQFPIRIAYTAHGEPITHVKKRIDQLIQHHEQRLSMIRNLASGRTAYEIASILFKKRELNPHQWRFAMAETIAHLNYLEFKRKLKKHYMNPKIYYERTLEIS